MKKKITNLSQFPDNWQSSIDEILAKENLPELAVLCINFTKAFADTLEKYKSIPKNLRDALAVAMKIIPSSEKHLSKTNAPNQTKKKFKDLTVEERNKYYQKKIDQYKIMI